MTRIGPDVSIGISDGVRDAENSAIAVLELHEHVGIADRAEAVAQDGAEQRPPLDVMALTAGKNAPCYLVLAGF